MTKEQFLSFFNYDKSKGKLYWKNHWNKMVLTRFKGKEAGRIDQQGYRRLIVCNNTYQVHRVIWFLENGTYPEMIDHINGDKSDNRIENLRDCLDSRNNQQNQYKHRKGKLVGASFHKWTGLWRATITIKGKQKHLGSFKTEFEAHERYLSYANKNNLLIGVKS